MGRQAGGTDRLFVRRGCPTVSGRIACRPSSVRRSGSSRCCRPSAPRRSRFRPRAGSTRRRMRPFQSSRNSNGCQPYRCSAFMERMRATTVCARTASASATTSFANQAAITSTTSTISWRITSLRQPDRRGSAFTATVAPRARGRRSLALAGVLMMALVSSAWAAPRQRRWSTRIDGTRS